MNGHCSTCPVEKDCAYEYKPCDCRDQFKFKPMPQPAQRTWVGLTDEELRQVWYDDAPVEGGTYVDKLRQVEAKLKEKNT